MKGKKGFSHIEVIISFTIFISMIALIFIFLRPIREPALDTLLLDTLEEAVRKETTLSLGTLPFKINVVSLGEDCFVFDHHLNFETPPPDQLEKKKIYVEDNLEQDILFKVTSTEMTIPAGNVDNFYFIHFTFDDSFTPPGEPFCTNPRTLVADVDIIFSTPRAETFFSFNKLKQEITDDNYKILKEKWFVPGRNDFSITIKNEDGSIDIRMDKQRPSPRKDVFARDISVNLLKQDMTGIIIERAVLSIKVW